MRHSPPVSFHGVMWVQPSYRDIARSLTSTDGTAHALASAAKRLVISEPTGIATGAL